MNNLKLSFKVGVFAIDAILEKVSEPFLRFILFIGWSAYLLKILLEMMRIYQF